MYIFMTTTIVKDGKAICFGMKLNLLSKETTVRVYSGNVFLFELLEVMTQDQLIDDLEAKLLDHFVKADVKVEYEDTVVPASWVAEFSGVDVYDVVRLLFCPQPMQGPFKAIKPQQPACKYIVEYMPVGGSAPMQLLRPSPELAVEAGRTLIETGAARKVLCVTQKQSSYPDIMGHKRILLRAQAPNTVMACFGVPAIQLQGSNVKLQFDF
jgi:hypothetical protein